MQKRGQFEIQFNWIFVLAVGAIIILFFTAIMLKQKSASEQTTNIFVLKNLEAILAGAEVSTGTVNFVNLPKVEIEFECNKYRIGSTSKRFEIMSVFTPSKIKFNKMMTWTLDWNVPYRITNFLYLTSPNIRYVLVGSNDLARKINKSMPKEMNKELVSDVNTVANKGEANVRFVYFYDAISDNSPVPSNFNNVKDVTALEVIEDTFNRGTGSVEFFEKEGTRFKSRGTSYYLKEPSLIGAVFTDDVEMYKCVMENAFKKLKIVTDIYKQKTQELQSYYSGTICANYHYLTNIQAILSASNNFDWPEIVAIHSASIALEDQNKQAQLYSCALIY